MRDFLTKNKIHVVLWAVMLVYLLGAHPFYVRFLLSDMTGKPVQVDFQIPENATPRIKCAFDSVSDLQHGLYTLNGWSRLYKKNDGEKFNRFVILQSDEATYFFSVQQVKQRFYLRMSREFIKPGSYHVAVLFQQKSDQSLYYKQTDWVINRTPNTLQLVQPQ